MSTLEVKELSHPAGQVIKIASGKTLDLKSQGTTTLPTGSVIQVANVQTGALISATVTIPFDNTIPQITEGTEYMTLNFTPTSASSMLLIDVVVNHCVAGVSFATAALFEGTTANALATSVVMCSNNSGFEQHSFRHKMTAGSTSQKTFRVRGGENDGNEVSFNGRGGGASYGGSMASSITVMEIQG